MRNVTHPCPEIVLSLQLEMSRQRHCGHCHSCGGPLRRVLDGEEWCDACGAYRRYLSHGFDTDDASACDSPCRAVRP